MPAVVKQEADETKLKQDFQGRSEAIKLRREVKLLRSTNFRLIRENARLRKMPKGKPCITLSIKRGNGFNYMLSILQRLDEELSTARKNRLSWPVIRFFEGNALG